MDDVSLTTPGTGTAQGNTDAAGDGAGQGAAAAGDGGTQQATTSWTDSLPEDLKANEVLKGFKDQADLAKAFLETRGKVPAVPENVDGYQVQVPEGHPIDPNFMGSVKKAALDAGLSQEQFAKIAAGYIAIEQGYMSEAARAQEEGLTKLKQEWGSQYDANIELTQRTIARFASKDEAQWLLNVGLERSPVLLRIFQKVGTAVSEDKFVEGGSPPAAAKRVSDAGNPILNFEAGFGRN